MNPTKYVTTEVKSTHTATSLAEIESTKWFDAATKQPGQPGVFEVDAAVLDDSGQEVRRFAYHNGRDFGPVYQHPQMAYVNRFEKRGTPVTKFRGLVEQTGASEGYMDAAMANLGSTMVFRNDSDRPVIVGSMTGRFKG